MAKLVIFGTDGRREIDLVEHNPMGRHPQNRVQILDRIASKEHCLIFLDKSRGYVLKDLGSLNGTFVNKNRVQGEIALRDGDEIVIGNTRAMFLGEEGAPGVAQMVDMSESVLQSHIRSKIASQVQDRFLPEKEIADDKIVRADYEKLRMTYELQRDIGFEFNIDRILERILERTFEFMNCDRGVILMFDDKGELRPRAVKTRAGKKDEKLVISSTLVKQVQKEKAGILSSDASMDNRFKGAHSIIMQGIRSSMAVPIIHKDELLGIMLIDSSVAVNAYTEKDLRLLSNIAHQTAQFIKNSAMAKKIEGDAATRARFERLLSPDVAEMIVSGQLTVEKGGENRVATVLFADIRGFTSMSENMEASEVLQMLNEYFEIMVEIVFKHDGTVDKFVGDEIMVLWGAPIAHPDDPARAVRAALEMQHALIGFNAMRASEGQGPIHIGIGINTGELVVGYIGSSRTMSYSVIGDSVNVAARLCSAAKAGEVVITEDTYELVKDEFETVMLEPLRAKGKAKPLKVFSVVKTKKPASIDRTVQHASTKAPG
ncbi:MAG: adenylate/guanylate cyclase domain-containing protein [Deltaproteobacteria bacterium]|nr:adenylate/guanylate cyclase domain-containing protein [Deltaproteobacteria bacterium]